MATASTKTPLLAPQEADGTPTPRGTATAVHALAWARALTGGLAFLSPALTAKLFLVPGVTAASMSAYQLRLFGVRDFVIGELLWVERPPLDGAPMDRRDRAALRRMLVANVVTDGLDVLATAGAFYVGAIPKPAALMVGGGAVAFLSLGLLGLARI